MVPNCWFSCAHVGESSRRVGDGPNRTNRQAPVSLPTPDSASAEMDCRRNPAGHQKTTKLGATGTCRSFAYRSRHLAGEFDALGDAAILRVVERRIRHEQVLE